MRTLRSVVLLWLLCGISLPRCFAATCTPHFKLEQNNALGWQGADAAYSVPLPDGRDVWIFGDTLYGKNRVVIGHAPQMVHNSLGISTCDAQGNFHLKYVIRRGPHGHAESFFSPRNPNRWYWALDGFAANGDLWVTQLCVEHAKQATPWAMDFATCGSDLARLSHLGHDPQHWTVRYFPLVPDGVKAYPSATTVVEGKYVYLFALYESGSRPLLVTRIPLKRLDNPEKSLEYLAADGQWKPGFDPAHAKQVMKTGTTELSIRYHPDLKKWLAIMLDPHGFSDKVILRSAPMLTGPWSAPQVIYRIPEMLPSPKRDKDTFCYAGKEHPEFEAPGELDFTYVCNTMDVPKLATNYSIYYPHFIQVPMPKPKLQP
ncbi:MAG TPA: DUF4185 domain-containing protein [Acidobacteriaceae bacterium]|nr:DUF4185 domain-containing protein [Acidobacteriaceae bacterium]